MKITMFGSVVKRDKVKKVTMTLNIKKIPWHKKNTLGQGHETSPDC